MNKPNAIITGKIDQFLNLYQGGLDAWTAAGKLIVEMVDADPKAYAHIISKAPAMTDEILGVFEKIGRGVLYAPLAMDSSPGVERLKLLPLSVQRNHECEPVDILVRKTDGSYDTLKVLPKNMTKAQAKLAFAKDRIRSLGEQRAVLAEGEGKAVPVRIVGDSSPWRIRGGRCEFIAGASLSAGEMATILTQLTR